MDYFLPPVMVLIRQNVHRNRNTCDATLGISKKLSKQVRKKNDLKKLLCSFIIQTDSPEIRAAEKQRSKVLFFSQYSFFMNDHIYWD